MKVKLITNTPNPELVIATAAKLCYANSDIETLMDGLTEEKITAFVNKLSDLGHESPIEHVTFTFGIEEVSRTLLAQITRHRLASFSVQSQRYVEEADFKFVTPKEIEKDKVINSIYKKQMETTINVYNEIADMLERKHYKIFIEQGIDSNIARNKANKKAIEDARYVLPNACCTKMLVTMNARSLLNFFKLRCCNRAQTEIRDLAIEMFKIVYPIAPTIFKNAGPSCVSCDKCTEGKMSCGKSKEVIELFNSIK